MLSTCPDLQKYLKDVFQTLSFILKSDVQPNPLVALFGTAGEGGGHLTPGQRLTLAFCAGQKCNFNQMEGSWPAHPWLVAERY